MSSHDASKQQQESSSSQKHEQPQRIVGSTVSSQQPQQQQQHPSNSLNICEMNADKEHAALDSWAEQHGKSMKQKEQLFEYREEEEAGINGQAAAKGKSSGGVFVGGHKVDDKVLQPSSAATSKKEGAEAASSK